MFACFKIFDVFAYYAEIKDFGYSIVTVAIVCKRMTNKRLYCNIYNSLQYLLTVAKSLFQRESAKKKVPYEKNLCFETGEQAKCVAIP